MWIPERGKRGCPSTARELVEDAEAIKEMIKELYGELDGVLHPELSDEQSARCDEIYNAVYEMFGRGYKVRFPAIVTEEDGSLHIEEYYEPDQEGGESENE